MRRDLRGVLASVALLGQTPTRRRRRVTIESP